MKYILFFTLLTLPFFQACAGDQHHGKAEAIQLDNGKRWIANSETTSGIADMQAILAKYEGQTSEVATRQAMRAELETTFQSIFKQCTMTGPAHDQLHNYLLPMKALFEKIEGNNTTEAEAAIGQLKQHLKDYQTFFQ
ncbi:MAG: hypothetical protein Q7T20_03510 [Saprospiraceae bacterium]|nr:hypothetical protein [Saprospiraceae bacterium]